MIDEFEEDYMCQVRLCHTVSTGKSGEKACSTKRHCRYSLEKLDDSHVFIVELGCSQFFGDCVFSLRKAFGLLAD